MRRLTPQDIDREQAEFWDEMDEVIQIAKQREPSEIIYRMENRKGRPPGRDEQ